MKLNIILILFCLSLQAHASGWVILGEYQNIDACVPYEYSIGHITGLSLNQLNNFKNTFTWKVFNGKIKDQSGEYTLTTLEMDALNYNRPVSIMWECKEKGSIEILELGIKIDVYINPCNVAIVNRDYDSSWEIEESGMYLTLINIHIRNKANVNFNGYRTVRILPGFIAEEGSTVRIYNEFPSPHSPTLMRNSVSNTHNEKTDLDYYKSELYQNSPNPANSMTIISFIIPKICKNAYIQFYNTMGYAVMKVPINSIGQNSIEINSMELTNGLYMYSLVVDDCLIDTKRMIVAN